MKDSRVIKISDVQLWLASPASFTDTDWQMLEAVLDADEKARAGNFQIQADRQAYVLAHAVRRIALGEELKVSPSRLVFSSEPSGKPTLIYPRCQGLGFSHAHTRGSVVFALSRESVLGVDIEAHQPLQERESLLQPFLSQTEEFAAPLGQPPLERESDMQAKFFFHWTALEAFWKAAGTGLSASNPRVGFERTRAGVYRAVLSGDAALPLARWVIAVTAPEGYSISLAVESPDTRVFTRRLTGHSLKGPGMFDPASFLPRPERLRAGTVPRLNPIRLLEKI